MTITMSGPGHMLSRNEARLRMEGVSAPGRVSVLRDHPARPGITASAP